MIENSKPRSQLEIGPNIVSSPIEDVQNKDQLKNSLTVKTDESLSEKESYGSSDSENDSQSRSDSEQSIDEKELSDQKMKLKAEELQKKIEINHQKNQEKDSPIEIDLLDLKDLKLEREIKKLYLTRKIRIFDTFYQILSILTFGVLSLLNKWSNDRLYEFIALRRVANLEKATTMVIINSLNQKEFIPITQKKLFINENLEFGTYIFKYNYQLYFWNEGASIFQNAKKLFESIKIKDFLKQSKSGIFESNAKLLQKTLGSNLLIFKKTRILSKVFDLISRPIVPFELISLFVLIKLNYVIYFWALSLFLAYKFCGEIYRKINREIKIQKKYLYQEKVMVIRRNEQKVHKKKIIDSSNLVPGDLIEITNNLRIPADVVLIYGSCVVKDNFRPNQNSTATKVSIEPNLDLSISQLDNKNLLLTGNKVLYTLNHINEGCFGIVVNTGFYTRRGESIRSLICNKTKDQTFIKDLYEYYFITALVAVVFSLAYLLFEFLYINNSGLKNSETFLKIFQIFIIMLKPAVPFAIFAAVDCSTKKLKNQNIFTNDKNKLSDMGKSRTFILEKNVLAGNESNSCAFLVAKHNDSEYKSFHRLINCPKKLFRNITRTPIIKKFVETYGLCNMVTKVGDEFFGDVQDVQMLKQSCFDLHYKFEDKGDIKRSFVSKKKTLDCFSQEYQTIRFFENKPEKNYKSVVVKNLEGEVFLYTKGEPSALEKNCQRVSLPYNYRKTVAKYSSKGYKCVALAFRKLSENEIYLPREQLEDKMTFIGFYLKKIEIQNEVPEVIEKLKEIKINLVTVSHESIYLCITAASKGGLLNHEEPILIGTSRIMNNVEKLCWEVIGVKTLDDSQYKDSQNDLDFSEENFFLDKNYQIALTGSAFKLLVSSLDSDQKDQFLKKVKIIGNLEEGQSELILNEFKQGVEKEYPLTYVHNGYGNLQMSYAADITISLRETEHSTVSTFFCRNFNLENLVHIVEESRTTLINKHKNFQFVIYFTVLQFVGLLMLFSKYTTFGTFHVFFMDFFILLVISYLQSNVVLGKLSRDIPSRSIFNKNFLVFIVTMTTYGSLMIILISGLLWKTKFYKSPMQIAKKTHSLNPDKNYFFDPFVIFIFFTLLNLRFILLNNSAHLFRKRFFKNWGLVSYLTCMFFFTFCLLFSHEYHKHKLIPGVSRIFRIPQLHGFEYLIALLAIIAIFGFYIVDIVRKILLKKWIEKGSNQDQICSEKTKLQASLIVESLRQSHYEKKSKKTTSKKSRRSQRIRRDSDAFETSIRTPSRLEKKRKPTRPRKKKKRRSTENN